jgi:hypothetical protein
MATTSNCGLNGSVTGGGEITKWTFVLEQELQDATSMNAGADNGYKQFTGCLKKGSGTFITLIPLGGVGAVASVKFENAENSYTADIIITEIGLTEEVNGIRSFSYTFVTTGEVT